ncbi:MAG: DMT family transporter [Polyangiaceae bacterium]|nr:DMT family transporter [Polyangiaceae bacterium]
MLAAQVLFAVMATSARASGHRLPWQEVCAARFAFGLLAVYVAARIRRRSLRIFAVSSAFWRSTLGTLSAAGTFYLYATPHLPLGDAATLLSTAPIFVTLLGAPLLGEPLRRGVIAALTIGFAGIALIAQPSFSSAGHVVALGTATAATSAMSFILLRRMGASETSEAIVFHFGCVGTATMVVLALPVWHPPAPGEAVALALTGISGGIAQLFMTRAYALDDASRVSILGYAGMVFTRALALPLFWEVPSAVQLTGSALVVASGAVLAARAAGAAPALRVRTDAEQG